MSHFTAVKVLWRASHRLSTFAAGIERHIEFSQAELCAAVMLQQQGDIEPSYICSYSPYRAVNTLRLCYRKESVNVVWGNISCFFFQIHTKHINTLCGQNVEMLNVKLVVHIVTTGLQRVKSLLYKPVS